MLLIARCTTSVEGSEYCREVSSYLQSVGISNTLVEEIFRVHWEYYEKQHFENVNFQYFLSIGDSEYSQQKIKVIKRHTHRTGQYERDYFPIQEMTVGDFMINFLVFEIIGIMRN